MSKEKLSKGIRSTSSFCAHRLHFSPEKVVVKPTAGNYIFFSIFAISKNWMADVGKVGSNLMSSSCMKFNF